MSDQPKNRAARLGATISLLAVMMSGCAASKVNTTAATSTPPAATEVLQAWKRADRLYARGEFLTARENYRMVLEREPNNMEVLFKLANIAYYLQDRDQARVLYGKVVDSGSAEPQLFYNRAALNLTEAYNDLVQYRDEVGPAGLTPEIRAVMAAVERMSAVRPAEETGDSPNSDN